MKCWHQVRCILENAGDLRSLDRRDIEMRRIMCEMRAVLFPVKCELYSNVGHYDLENAAGNFRMRGDG